MKYLKCPNVEHRRYRQVAQQQNVDGSWRCTGCGLSHIPMSAPTGRRSALLSDL